MKDLTIRNTLITNILLLKGVCKNLSEAITYSGPELEKAEMIADKAIQSFARTLNLLNSKGDLYMGATHVPFEKQNSLRLFKKTVQPEDVAEAIHRMYMVETGRYRNVTIHDDFTELTDEEIKRLYNYLEPWFLLLEVPMTAEHVINAVRN